MLYRPFLDAREGGTVGTVDIPGLNMVGAAVTGSAAGFKQTYADHAGQLEVGGSTVWATTQAVSAAAERWGGFVQQLAGQVRGLGVDLSRAAADYQASDDAAASRVNTAGIPAGHPALGRAYGYGPQ
jgi:hypothetical protein